jgi:hypothetical protein
MKTLVKSLAALTTLSLGLLGAVGFNQKTMPALAASTYTLTPGSTVYAFVPSSWVSDSRFLTMKFTGSADATSSSTAAPTFEGFSQNTDTAKNSDTHTTTKVIYQLKRVSNHLYSCTIPTLPSGYTNPKWSRMQVLSYPSASLSKDWSLQANWTASTAIAVPSGEEIYVYPTAAATGYGQTGVFATRTYDAALEALNEWAISSYDLFAASDVCGTTKNAAVGDSTAAGKIFQAGWALQGNAWSSLTDKLLFTNATTSNAANTYYLKFALQYDYILAKYGTTYTSNYASRTIKNLANLQNPIIPVSASESSTTIFLASLATLAAFAAGGYFFLKKKKEA